MSWLCASRARIRDEKTSSFWSTPTTATPTYSSTSALTNSTAREAAARGPGSMLRRLRMITAACIAATTNKRAQSMRITLRKFSRAPATRAIASLLTWRRHCQASAARSFFRRIIWRRFTVTCAEQAQSASPTKYRWASGALERTAGDSESPAVRSKAPEAHLYFVGDADCACSAHVTVNLRQIIRRKNDLAADAWQCLRHVSSDAMALVAGARENFRNVMRILCARLFVVAAIHAAVIIRKRRNMDPGPLAAASRAVEFVRADVDEYVGVAVVGVLQNDDVFSSRMRAREAQSQLISLAPGIHKKTNAQRVGKQPRQPLGVAVDVVVKIARVRVQQRKLRLRRLDHARVAVPYERHVVVNVEIRTPRIVIQILHPSANNFQRALIRDAEVFSQQGAARGKCLRELLLFRWKTIGRNSDQQICIRREARPYGTLRSISNARKIGPQIQHIQNDLKMNVWRPPPIFLC